MITLDTSALLALADRGDREHAAVAAALTAEAGPYVVPAGIIGEAGYMLGVLGGSALDAFLADLSDGRFTYDAGAGDFPRIRELVARYEDLGLGLADAAVVACAERRGGRVLTTDRRDFRVVAGEGRIHLVLDA
jgi:predicted nucleic acid-binding protein